LEIYWKIWRVGNWRNRNERWELLIGLGDEFLRWKKKEGDLWMEMERALESVDCFGDRDVDLLR